MVRENYVQQLESVKADLSGLGDMVCEMLALSSTCLLRGGKKCHRDVVSMEAKAKRRFLALEEKCLRIMARQQPVASDLRFITSALHAARKLERCGSYASDISQTAMLLGHRVSAGLPEIRQMAQSAEAALRISVRGFAEKDMLLSNEVAKLEADTDAQLRALLEKLKTEAQKGRSHTEIAFRTYMISKYLERAADNAVRITNATGYMVTGDRKYLLD
jgi:phosphate transport system protein